MQCVILAGGLGTRISEETQTKPKPMVRIGGVPLLIHIMSTYNRFGYNRFLIACGYRGDVIKDYFANLEIFAGNTFFNFKNGEKRVDVEKVPEWSVGCIDTGLETMTGGRIKRLREFIGNERFMVTYGDGLANIDINELVDFHIQQGRIGTITAVCPPARFGALSIEDNLVTTFKEKQFDTNDWINGGYFVFEPEIFDLIEADDTKLEGAPLETLSNMGQLSAFKHRGFWQPMDTLREYNELEALWNSGDAPWTLF